MAEAAIGRKLPLGAVVHHVNGNGLDNTPTNLVICPSQAYHLLIHQRQRALDARGNADWRKCQFCKQYDAVENLYLNNTAYRHRTCANEYAQKLKETRT